jgi:hypothetical protein
MLAQASIHRAGSAQCDEFGAWPVMDAGLRQHDNMAEKAILSPWQQGGADQVRGDERHR